MAATIISELPDIPATLSIDSDAGFPAYHYNGSIYTGGAPNTPHVLFDTPLTVTPAGWNAGGTVVAMNLHAAFSGDYLSFKRDNVLDFSVGAGGVVTAQVGVFAGGGAGQAVYGAATSGYGLYGASATGVGVLGTSGGGTAGLLQVTDAQPALAPGILILTHALTGAPVAPAAGAAQAGIGAGILFQAADDSGVVAAQATITTSWTTVATLTRTSAVIVKVVNAGAAAAEVARFIPTGMLVQGAVNAGALVATNATNQLQLGGAGAAFKTIITAPTPATADRLITVPDLSGTVMVAANLGIAGQVLTSGGASATPTWGTLGALTDAGTTTVPTLLSVNHASSGTPAAGFGSVFAYLASSDTTASRTQGIITTSWAVAADASRTARMTLAATDFAGNREGLRIESTGTAALVSLYGVAAVARQTAVADATDLASAIALTNNLKAIIKNIGIAQ